MGNKANLVKFIWFVKYFFNVFAADLNLRKKCFSDRHAGIFFIMADYKGGCIDLPNIKYLIIH